MIRSVQIMDRSSRLMRVQIMPHGKRILTFPTSPPTRLGRRATGSRSNRSRESTISLRLMDFSGIVTPMASSTTSLKLSRTADYPLPGVSCWPGMRTHSRPSCQSWAARKPTSSSCLSSTRMATTGPTTTRRCTSRMVRWMKITVTLNRSGKSCVFRTREPRSSLQQKRFKTDSTN